MLFLSETGQLFQHENFIAMLIKKRKHDMKYILEML